MVKKIMTGLAISIGAGLAFTATSQAKKKKGGWGPAKSEGTLTPVSIRMHPTLSRNEQPRTDLDEPMALATTPERSAELAEIRVMIESLENRTNEMMGTINQRIDDLQNHLPRFIDVKVTSRIREVEERLRTEFQDEQSRTLDAFLQTLDQKVLPRIAHVEEAVGAQGEEIGRMRQRIEKTDDTLGRVLGRIEKAVDSMTPSSGGGYTNSHVMEISQKAVA
jgi:hypothetical protein